jgi:uncharacterized membrane protein YphA (DoxX/SURF4 family)
LSVQRILGIVILAAGVIFIIFGITALRSFGNQMSHFFMGRPTETTLWYLIGGVVAAVAGVALLLGRPSRS